ncbi:MAG TPA: response regulator [Acidimicrobiales bacterium]|nr:response regulator [Acidimicrobiales bacterium]
MSERPHVLADLTRAFSEAVDDERALLALVADLIGQATGDACTVRLLSEDGSRLEPVSAYHPDPEGLKALRDAMARTDRRPDIGIWGPVMNERRPVRFTVTEEEAPASASPEQVAYLRAARIPGFVAAPLVARGRVIGGISLVRYGDAPPFTDDDEAFLADMADRAALAIDNARLLTAERAARTEAEQATAEAHAALAQRERAERLLEAADRSRLLLEATANGIYGIDHEGRCTFVNRVAAEALGWEPADLEGTLVHDLVHHHDAEGVPVPWEECPVHVTIDEGRETRVEGAAFWRKDGTVFPAEMAARPVVDGGTVVGAVVSFTDITERMRWAADIEAAREQALVLARLKSEFLATMSHEIRTPMNGVIGMAGLLLDTDLDPEQREYAETVRNSARALLAIINDILDFSKIEAGRLELEEVDFDLGAAAEEVGELLAEEAHAKGLELAMFVDPALPAAVRGDPGRLRQVLTNLVGNAVKFTDAGEVVVAARVAESGDEVVTVRFEVRDTGIGIADDLQEHLFDSFTQADASTTRRFGGTGLGLAISRRLVEMMGGRIGVDSEPGRGSTFWFTVPLARAAPAPALRRGKLSGTRVLVADDSAVNRTILAAQLEAWGMEPTLVASGAEAVAVAQAAAVGHPFEVVVTDFQMPGMDGIDLADVLNVALEPAPPVIVLSSAGGREVARGRGGDNCAAFLVKPARRSQLFDAIAVALGTAPERNRPSPGRPEPAVPEEARGRGMRILVADDNPVNQRLAALLLERMEYRVDTVGDGAEAVTAVFRGGYDAVVMDCEMPGMDGYQASGEIRRREAGSRHIPIVAVTASVLHTDVERALAAGMDAHVGKPIDRNELARTLARLLRDVDGPGDGTADRALAAQAEAADERVLDSVTVDQLKQLDGNGDIRELLQMFLRDAPALVDRLAVAAGRGDAAEAAAASHKLTGSAGAFGALRVVHLAQDVEAAARDGAVPGPAMVAALRSALDAAIRALVSQFGDAPPPPRT